VIIDEAHTVLNETKGSDPESKKLDGLAREHFRVPRRRRAAKRSSRWIPRVEDQLRVKVAAQSLEDLLWSWCKALRDELAT
jgi:hypothetical protein